MFETECAELAAMANDHTIEGCATGWLDCRPVKNTRAFTVTQDFEVAKKDIPDPDVVPYALANTIRSYQRATVNPMVDAYRLSAIANTAAIRDAETVRMNTLVARIKEQTNEVHRRWGGAQLVVMLNSRLYARLLKTTYFSLLGDGLIHQGGVSVVCKKAGEDLVLPVREQLLKSEYDPTEEGVCPTLQAQTFNWIICPYGLMTGETATEIKFSEASLSNNDAWVFNYTKTLNLFERKEQSDSIAVSIANERKDGG